MIGPQHPYTSSLSSLRQSCHRPQTPPTCSQTPPNAFLSIAHMEGLGCNPVWQNQTRVNCLAHVYHSRPDAALKRPERNNLSTCTATARSLSGIQNWNCACRHLLQGHYFDIYVNSPQFPEPWPAPQMAGVDPIAHQKAKQARARHQDQQAAASAAGVGGTHGASRGAHDDESTAAESGVQQAKHAAVLADAETAHGPAKRVRGLKLFGACAS